MIGEKQPKEHWERMIEHEIRFYVNIEEYENRLMDRYYESQMIQLPITIFNDLEGRIYRQCPNTEEQALDRIESKEAITSILNRAVKRINRLNRAFKHLTDKEINLISMYYFEGNDHLPRAFLSRQLGYSTVQGMMAAKEKALKKVLAIYEKEKLQVLQEKAKILKEELLSKDSMMEMQEQEEEDFDEA